MAALHAEVTFMQAVALTSFRIFVPAEGVLDKAT